MMNASTDDREAYWEILTLLWDNEALLDFLQRTCYTFTPVSDEYIKWAGEL